MPTLAFNRFYRVRCNQQAPILSADPNVRESKPFYVLLFRQILIPVDTLPIHFTVFKSFHSVSMALESFRSMNFDDFSPVKCDIM